MENQGYDLMPNETDKRCFERLKGFIPDKVFDMHTHIWDCETIPSFAVEGSIFAFGPKEVGYTELKKLQKALYPDAKVWRNNFLTIPDPEMTKPGSRMLERANDFMVRQLEENPGNVGALAVLPGMTKEAIERGLVNENIKGFKCYHITAARKPTWNTDIEEYLPEAAWQVAHERIMFITLHMVKDKALSDKKNLEYIIDRCTKYPGAKLILAHGARGFAPYNTIDSIHCLRGLENIYFDCSAVCESKALAAILKEFGPRKMLWGSDFPVSVKRGKCVSIADSFLWLYNEDLEKIYSKTSFEAALIGTENLLALKEACEQQNLSKKDIEDVFYNNAIRVLGLEENAQNVTQELYLKAKSIFPGGTQLLSKRPELYAPEVWPAYYTEARGCEVWDVDGRHYYDMASNAVGAALLGYGDPDVDNAVKRRINLGVISSLNPVQETEAAMRLLDMHPWASCARIGRPGGEIASVAIRIARATKDKSKVAICGYHGWHDWYLAANLGEDDTLRDHLLPGLGSLGVPRELRGTAFAFRYGSFEEFDRLMDKQGNELAAVIMEPARGKEPPEGFLEHVRNETQKRGILLIFDEITIGFRIHAGGSHLKFGVFPDMAIFGKSLGNGYCVSAVIGTREAMEGAHESFISSSYWTEGIGPAAACAVLEKHVRVDVVSYIDKVGKQVKRMWNEAAAAKDIPIKVNDEGYGPMASFVFHHSKAQELKTLYTQLMLKRGFLASPSFMATMAHDNKVLSLYKTAVLEVFDEISDILNKDGIERYMTGPVCQPGFRRLI